MGKVAVASAHAFLYGLRRFIARRVMPRTIICDNALHFRAADEVFQEVVGSEAVIDCYSRNAVHYATGSMARRVV